MVDRMRRDVRTVLERDPAARSALEVVLCSPGVHAIWIHRIAHALLRAGWLTGRWCRVGFLTSIEIHRPPSSARAFIDHGIRRHRRDRRGGRNGILQGVTLGGTSLKLEKRHPTIGDNVMIGAGAKVIGGFTIGAGSRIGAGSVVVREVPENCVVVGVPGRITFRNGERVSGAIDLNQTDLPDPLARALEQMAERIHALEAEIERLKKAADVPADAPAD
jgi:serine O-acetyltransferase